MIHFLSKSSKARTRFFWLLATVVSVAMGMGIVFIQLREHLVFFYTPTELLAHSTTHPQMGVHDIRVGGLIQEGSILHHTGLHKDITQFILTDGTTTITIQYRGILPPMFREGQGMVARGRWDAAEHRFMARELLTKHDENYKPPELQRALSGKEEG